jgi:hypothetical protein
MYNTIGKTASFGKFLGSWGAEFAGNVETFVVMVFFFFSLYEERGGGVTKIWYGMGIWMCKLWERGNRKGGI